MRKILLAVSMVALMGSSAWAQTTVVEPVPGQPGAPPLPSGQAPGQPSTMYAAKAANIRAGAGKGYNTIGKTHVNDALQIAGFVPGNPGWYQLATGGFISAAVVSPTPVTIVQRPMIVPAPAGQYPVGACEPYSRIVKIGGEPNQITGTACKNPDGTWSIVNYSVPTPAPEAAPVYVAPAPLVYGPPPPPVVVVEHPWHGPWRGPGPGPGYYERY